MVQIIAGRHRHIEVCSPWITHPEPWLLEDELIDTLDLPLNIDGADNTFTATLRAA